MFQLVDWLSREGVEIVERGPNVARDHVNIQCPFCGVKDHSHHMGVRIRDGAWGCWRDSRHRGRSPIRLIMAIKRCSYETACAIAGVHTTPPPDSVAELRARLGSLDKPKEVEEFEKVELDKGFKEPAWTPYREKFCAFLRRYALEDRHIAKFVKRYGLLSDITGDWANRVIVPIYHPLSGALYGWTGRLIVPSDKLPRYKAWPPGNQVKQTPYCPQVKQPYDDVLIVEGPFDAMKFDYFCPFGDIQVLAAQGTSMTDDQVSVVSALAGTRPVTIAFDAGATAQAMTLRSQLAFLSKVRLIPITGDEGFEDFGEATCRQIQDWAREHFS